MDENLNQSTFTLTKFSALKFWDVYSLSCRESIKSNYDLVELSEVISHRKGSITINEIEKYKRCRVRLHSKGIILRDEVLGSEIKTKKQQLCKPDDFLVAEIDAKVGGYGIVPDSLENAIVSSHYFIFEINKKRLLPEYLGLVIKCNGFSKQIKATGSTNYAAIRPYHVLDYKIPLPDIQTQRFIVDMYYKKVRKALRLEDEAVLLKKAIKTYLNGELGIIEHKIEKKIGELAFIRFKDVEVWGVDKNIQSLGDQFSTDYQITKIENISTVSSGGTPSRSRKDYYENGTIPWVKTTEVRNNIITSTGEKITELGLGNSSAKLYPAGSLIIAMYGQGVTRGRTAKLGMNAATNQACAVITEIDDLRVDSDFLWVYLINEYDRLRALASGNNQPNLNAGMIKNYPVVLPPISKQKKIVKKTLALGSEGEAKRILAKELNHLAIEELQNEIF